MRMLYTPVCLTTLHFLNTGFIFENHVEPTPYTIGTKYSPKLATSTIFMQRCLHFSKKIKKIHYRDRPSLTISNQINVYSAFKQTIIIFMHDHMSLTYCIKGHHTPASLAPSHTPCLFSIDLHTVRQHLVIVHILLLLLYGALFQMMSGVPHHCHHLSLV